MTHSYSYIIIIALIAWSIYRRVRRNIGWQLLYRGNLVFRIILFTVVGLLFFAEGVVHPISLISNIAGILVGCILAYYGITLTKLEQREGRVYYLPNIWIGSIVTVIFLARFIYRFYGLFSSGVMSGQSSNMQNMGMTMGNSWTSGLMLIMFAYYIIYYVVLMKKEKRLEKAVD
ncbi:hypothetical protein PU629_02350 [Pullulanibacillus sp. KACC 23026]|uniref:hypothetical protein n=1 Tax=Pullulanibacillus sp. KACC 23026 TaxID=3028315 RepID=UPI0023B06564|nr:hypothetical protein [Pullulanibacillus sp. KACC 23026]WEG13226.1 hypothetical protein PU629_02350 [Pullulanibacillus sp. KACC 23026]